MNLIHQDALAGRGPFRDWQPRDNWRKVLRGDLVTWFGFEHVETVRAFRRVSGQVWVRTEGGNTTSGNAGRQSDGGGSFPRWRLLSDADGFARVDYPGGAIRRGLDRLAMRAEARKVVTDHPSAVGVPSSSSSDSRLVAALEKSDHPSAVALRAAVKAALNA